MAAFEDLLTVQEHDTAIDRLRVQRDKLTERAELVEQRAEAGQLEARLEDLRARRDEIAREEKRYEDNVAAIEARRAEVEQAMYSGSTSNPKELQAMQAEVEQFNRQQSNLEDQEIDAMEQREGLEAEIAEHDERLKATVGEIDRLQSSLDASEREIDEQISAEQGAREALVPKLPADLVDLYEKIRSKNNGVGAARLAGGTCQGCHLALPAVEVDRVKKQPPDALVRCEQCGCILVR